MTFSRNQLVAVGSVVGLLVLLAVAIVVDGRTGPREMRGQDTMSTPSTVKTPARYGDSDLRTIEDYEARGMPRIASRESAEGVVGRQLPHLANTGGRSSLGFAIGPSVDEEQLLKSGAEGADADLVSRQVVFEFFDGLIFIQIPHADASSAKSALESLYAVGLAPDEQPFWSTVQVRGVDAHLVDYHDAPGIYVDSSQLSWVEGSVFYALRSHDGVVSAKEIIQIANSMVSEPGQ